MVGLAMGFMVLFIMGFFIIVPFFIMGFLPIIFLPAIGFFIMGLLMVEVCAMAGTTRVAMAATARIWLTNFME